MFAQLVFMRLASTVFHGNELTYCIITGHWLLWTSLGSRWGSSLIKKKKVEKLLPVISLLYILALIIFAYIVYLIRPILNFSNSEILGFDKIFLIMGAVLAIPTLLNGMFFPVQVKFIKNRMTRAPVSGIYAADVFGSALGSIIFAGLIFLNFTTFHNIHIISIIIILALVTILLQNRQRKILVLLLIPILVISIIFLKNRVLQIRWNPMKVVDYYETPYQEIVETRYEGDKVVYGNGEVMPVYGNVEFAEELIHFPLLSHEDPKSVLIIGLIDSTIVGEITKYPSVDSITIINENRELQRKLAGKINSEEISVNYYFLDPVTDIDQLDTKFDIAILNISQPLNILWNRFYTSEFFSSVDKILHKNGNFALTLPGGENYLSQEHISFLKTISNTLQRSFQNISWIPGETVHLIAGPSNLKINYSDIVAELTERNINNQYITDYYLVDRLSAMKIDFLHRNINSVQEKSVNTLMAPIAFYYNTILWDKKSGGFLSPIYKNMDRINGYLFSALMALLMLIMLFARRNSSKFFINEMMLVGFYHMIFENLLIIIFQSFIGALYLKIVFLFFAFMTGAGLGALFYHRTGMKSLQKIPFWIMFALPVILFLIIRIDILMGFLLPLLLFISGLIDGCLFPYILNRFKEKEESSLAGRLYSADVLGSCLGSYLFSAFILPIWGIRVSIFFLALVGLAMLLGELSRK